MAAADSAGAQDRLDAGPLHAQAREKRLGVYCRIRADDL
jgi:hypothetical protein